jgi:hypothetical protein
MIGAVLRLSGWAVVVRDLDTPCRGLGFQCQSLTTNAVARFRNLRRSEFVKKHAESRISAPALQRRGKMGWDRYTKPAWWLDASREGLAIAFCELWAGFAGL